MKSLLLSRTVNLASRGRIKYGWWTADFHSQQEPIFVGGASRSGTTLLTSLLSSHPQICIGPETGIFEGNRKLDHLQRLTKLPSEWLGIQLRESCCQGEFIELILRRLAGEAGKPRWGEKTPSNIRHLPRIFQWFPRAKFVHIIRDGRDVVCSLRTHPEHEWRNGDYVKTGIVNPWSQCVAEWDRDVRSGLAWSADQRYYEIKYEELVASPQRCLTGLFHWLGQDWSDEVLTHYRRDGMPNHTALAGPITQASVARWRNDLDAEARRQFRGSANELLKKLNYVEDDRWIDEVEESVLEKVQ